MYVLHAPSLSSLGLSLCGASSQHYKLAFVIFLSDSSILLLLFLFLGLKFYPIWRPNSELRKSFLRDFSLRTPSIGRVVEDDPCCCCSNGWLSCLFLPRLLADLQFVAACWYHTQQQQEHHPRMRKLLLQSMFIQCVSLAIATQVFIYALRSWQIWHE